MADDDEKENDEEDEVDCDFSDDDYGGIGCLAVLGIVMLTEGAEKLWGQGYAYMTAGTLLLLLATMAFAAKNRKGR